MGKGPRKRRMFTVEVGLLNGLSRLSEQTEIADDDLADEAFRDLLKKHRVPASFEEALRQSARQVPANDRAPKRKSKKRSR